MQFVQTIIMLAASFSLAAALPVDTREPAKLAAPITGGCRRGVDSWC